MLFTLDGVFRMLGSTRLESTTMKRARHHGGPRRLVCSAPNGESKTLRAPSLFYCQSQQRGSGHIRRSDVWCITDKGMRERFLL